MAATGKRTWEPVPDNPALIIITDEYAELPEKSHEYADSVARRGRAVSVDLIAATQRPTLAAMGRNTAVRSQMDVRICLRVREPRDTDLILGQGSLNSGWHPHKLTQPGEFLISDPEHATTERNRAYLITDETRDQHAARFGRPPAPLPAPVPDTPWKAPEPPQARNTRIPRSDRPFPEHRTGRESRHRPAAERGEPASGRGVRRHHPDPLRRFPAPVRRPPAQLAQPGCPGHAGLITGA